MRKIIFDVGQFEPYCGNNVRPSEMLIYRLLEDMCWMNCVLLKCQGPNVPWLYDAGRNGQVRYQREPPGIELFNGIMAVLREKGGDCDDLTAWRIAELRVRGDHWDVMNQNDPQTSLVVPKRTTPYYPNGEQAEFFLKKYERPGKPLLYHVLVRRAPTPEFPQGFLEDPSKALGMT